jgi:carboxyl-terminal processing protease
MHVQIFGECKMGVLNSLWKWIRQLPLSVMLPLVFVIGYVFGTQSNVLRAQSLTSQPPEAEEAFAPFWQVYNLIQADYIDEVDQTTLIEGAIDGMVNSLGDQFSGYMNPDVFAEANQELEGEISGIGVVIRTNEETTEIEVVGILENTPAQAAGIQVGDVFAEVEGKDMTGVNQAELATLVRGPEGTNVTIMMRRGDELIEFVITRATIEVPNVESEMLEDNIGYVKLNQFSDDARIDMENAINEFNDGDLDGLIIDFRGNGGGYLTSAIDVASLLVNEGLVVTEEFGDGEQTTFNANGDALTLNVPIVLLVDETSASASELVAGAWQDTEEATIMGEQTFGKGTVQTWHALVNGGGVRLTIARWLTPEGNWIHGNGITPDIEVDWDPATQEEAENDLQLQQAINHLLRSQSTSN